MKWAVSILLVGLLLGCSVFGYDRLCKVKFINQSGLAVKKAVLYFTYETGHVIDKVEIKDLAVGEAVEVLYNLEHLEGFNDMSGKVSVEFKEFFSTGVSNNLFSFDLRRTHVDYTITIKSDTLIAEWSRK